MLEGHTPKAIKYILARNSLLKSYYLITKYRLKGKPSIVKDDAFELFSSELFERFPDKLTVSHRKILQGNAIIRVSRRRDDLSGFKAGLKLRQTGERELIQTAPLD